MCATNHSCMQKFSIYTVNFYNWAKRAIVIVGYPVEDVNTMMLVRAWTQSPTCLIFFLILFTPPWRSITSCLQCAILKLPTILHLYSLLTIQLSQYLQCEIHLCLNYKVLQLTLSWKYKKNWIISEHRENCSCHNSYQQFHTQTCLICMHFSTKEYSDCRLYYNNSYYLLVLLVKAFICSRFFTFFLNPSHFHSARLKVFMLFNPVPTR